MNIYYVYQYLRSKDSDVAESGTPYYIGKGKSIRAWNKEHCTPMPSDNSLIEILITGLSEKAAHELEVMLIKKYGRIDLGTGILRNKTNGGEGISGYQHSDYTKQKISKAKVGKPVSLEHRENLRKSLLARAEKLGIIHCFDRKNRSQGKKGKVVSEETRRKISATLKGVSKSAVTRTNMTNAKIGHVVSDETRAKISATKKQKYLENKLFKICVNLPVIDCSV